MSIIAPRRSALVAVDQGIYSISNFLLQVAVLRSSTVKELAAFSVGYATYWLIAGSARALFGESQLVLAARTHRLSDATPPGRWVAVYCLVSLLPGVLTAYAVRDSGLLVGGAMALSAPAVVFADYVRYALLVRESVGKLIFLDALWLGIQVSVFAVLFVGGWAPSYLLVLVWAGGAVLAAALCGAGLHLAWRGGWDGRTGRGMAGEFLVTSGIQQALPAVLYGVGLLSPLASLRAAQTLVSPLNTIFTAGTTIFYGRMRRVWVRPAALGGQLAVCLALAVAAYGGLLLTAPQSLVEDVFGPAALLAGTILLPIVLQIAANGVATGGILANRILSTPRENFTRRVFTAPVLLLTPLLGVWMGGSDGLGWGMLVGSGITAMVWWLAACRATKE